MLVEVVELRRTLREESLGLEVERRELCAKEEGLMPLVLRNRALRYLKAMITAEIGRQQGTVLPLEGVLVEPDLRHNFEGEMEMLRGLKRQASLSVAEL